MVNPQRAASNALQLKNLLDVVQHLPPLPGGDGVPWRNQAASPNTTSSSSSEGPGGSKVQVNLAVLRRVLTDIFGIHQEATACLKLAAEMGLLPAQVDQTQPQPVQLSTARDSLQQCDAAAAAPGLRDITLAVAEQGADGQEQGLQQQQQLAAVGGVAVKDGCGALVGGWPSDVLQQNAAGSKQSHSARLTDGSDGLGPGAKRRCVHNPDTIPSTSPSAAAAPMSARPFKSDAVGGASAADDPAADAPQTPCSAHFVFAANIEAKEEGAAALPGPPVAEPPGVAMLLASMGCAGPSIASEGLKAFKGHSGVASEAAGAGHAPAAKLMQRVAVVMSRAQAVAQLLSAMVVPCAAELLIARQEIAAVSRHALPEAHANMAAAVTTLRGLEASVLQQHQQLTQARALVVDKSSQVTQLQAEVAAAQQRQGDQRQRVVEAVAELVDIAHAAADWSPDSRRRIIAVCSSLLQAFAEPAEVQLPAP
eukprot:gene13276-13407_t